MWLDIGELASEEFFGAIACELFDGVVVGASAVVAASGVAFGVFVGHAGSGGDGDCGGGVVFARDELDRVFLTVTLGGDDVGDLGVGGADGVEDGLVD